MAQTGRTFLGKAAEIASLAISELMDTLAQFEAPANPKFDDYLGSRQCLEYALDAPGRNNRCQRPWKTVKSTAAIPAAHIP